MLLKYDVVIQNDKFTLIIISMVNEVSFVKQ